MRSLSRIFMFLACCLLLVHCSDNSIIQTTDLNLIEPDIVVKDLGVDISIGYGQTILIEEEHLFITFTGLTEGRCPTGAVCFWEGQASTEFTVIVPNERPAIATLIIRPSGKPDTNPEMTDYALGYVITILQLDPYPNVEYEYPLEDYVAVLRIERIPDDGDCGRIVPTWTPRDLLQRDPVTVHEGAINGDVLTLTVSYSGGCGDHAFKLYWIPVFMESYPVQTNLFFQHVNIDDFCEAIIATEHSYSIREIAELYADCYGGYDDIVLNVYGYFEDEPEQKISVTYSPE